LKEVWEQLEVVVIEGAYKGYNPRILMMMDNWNLMGMSILNLADIVIPMKDYIQILQMMHNLSLVIHNLALIDN